MLKIKISRTDSKLSLYLVDEFEILECCTMTRTYVCSLSFQTSFSELTMCYTATSRNWMCSHQTNNDVTSSYWTAFLDRMERPTLLHYKTT